MAPGRGLDLIVIGGGITGLAAARMAAEHGLEVACLQEDGMIGGLVMNVGQLEGYPAPGPLDGASLAASLMQSGAAAGAGHEFERATEIAPAGRRIAVKTETGHHEARAVLLATGARLKTLGVPGEAELAGRGVSQCAFCDAAFFKDRDVVVVGGGDAALQEALHLTEYAARVTVVTRGNLRARRGFATRAAEIEHLQFRWQTTVTEILGADGVEGVRLEGPGGAEMLACAGVFVFIGQEPASALAPEAVARDDTGCVATDPATHETALPGLFAAGAVRAGYGGLLTDAVGEAGAAMRGILARLGT